MINPLGLKDRDAVKAELAARHIDVPVLMDDARLISEALGIDKIGEVLVYNPKSFTVMFRGPVGEELTTALTDIVAGRDVQTIEVASTGHGRQLSDKKAHQQQAPSYEKEIGPIIARELCYLPSSRWYSAFRSRQPHHGNGLVADDSRGIDDQAHAAGTDRSPNRSFH